VQGAAQALAAGASVIVMDDGFQNPSLTKDFSLLVVDAQRGVGNGAVFPAGPLRAPFEVQMRRAQALLLVGAPARESVIEATVRAPGIPVFRARLEPDAGFISSLAGRRVLAFAGIGDPAKFFATLAKAGVAVAATRGFPDHHPYTRGEADSLCREADRDRLILVTTEKDAARMQGREDNTALAGRSRPLPVTLVFEDEAAFAALLRERIAAARRVAGDRIQLR
jgi:tetraacyldisaccharide 4'-kinase